MKEIKLRNYKTESLVVVLGAFVLGTLILFWASQNNMTLRVSGAKLDRATSTDLLYIISIGPIITGIDLLIKYFSLLRYGEFTMIMEVDKFVYPEYKIFRGFKRKETDKNRMSYAKLYLVNNKPFLFYFVNKENIRMNVIETEIMHPSVVLDEAVEKINAWIGQSSTTANTEQSKISLLPPTLFQSFQRRPKPYLSDL